MGAIEQPRSAAIAMGLCSMLVSLGCSGGNSASNATPGTCTGAACATVANPMNAAASAGAVQDVPSAPGASTGASVTPATPPASATGGTTGSGAAGAGAGTAGAMAPAQATMPPPPAGSSGCDAATWPPAGTDMLDVGGTQRTYIVALPNGYDSHKPYKLIFAWHGLGGSAQQIAGGFAGFGYYGLQSMAGDSAIFVAPQGLDTGITLTNGMPGNTTADGGTPPAGSTAGWSNTNDQDIAFTRAMLDTLRASYCVDDARIFSVGMSFGGIMSNTVGCELGDVFRAIAPMSGSGPRQGFGASACAGQVAAWIAHGNMDMTVPFAQGQASRDFWAMANHCSSDTMPVDPTGCVTYQGCDAGYPVTWCEFDGGHTIWQPSSAAIWAFFSQF